MEFDFFTTFWEKTPRLYIVHGFFQKNGVSAWEMESNCFCQNVRLYVLKLHSENDIHSVFSSLENYILCYNFPHVVLLLFFRVTTSVTIMPGDNSISLMMSSCVIATSVTSTVTCSCWTSPTHSSRPRPPTSVAMTTETRSLPSNVVV